MTGPTTFISFTNAQCTVATKTKQYFVDETSRRRLVFPETSRSAFAVAGAYRKFSCPQSACCRLNLNDKPTRKDHAISIARLSRSSKKLQAVELRVCKIMAPSCFVCGHNNGDVKPVSKTLCAHLPCFCAHQIRSVMNHGR